MNFQKFALVSALLLFVLLLGCVYNAPENRLLCLDLASYSQTSVPSCSTQQDCFSKVNSEFQFSAGNFSAGAEQQLMFYKNHIALSWLYYNRAMRNIKSIYNTCHSSTDISGITQQVNELNSNLLNAFYQSDEAAKASFGLIALEASELELQDINLMREEPVFNDYVLLMQNINDLSTSDAAKRTSSYVSLYFSRLDVYNHLAAELGFEPLRMNQFSVYDLLAMYYPPVSGQFPIKPFYMPLITEGLGKVVDYLFVASKLGDAASVLRRIPSFELMNSYNSLTGAEASAASEFAKLINNADSHLGNAVQRSAFLQRELQKLFSGIDAKISSLDSSTYAAFDANFFAELNALLSGKSVVQVQGSEFSDISKFKGDAELSLLVLEQRLRDVQQGETLGNSTLGARLSELKRIYTDASRLLAGISSTSSGLIESLDAVCSSRIELISEKVKGAALEDAPLAIADMRARLRFKISEFSSAENPEQRIALCKPLVEQYLQFQAALSDFSAYKADVLARINECTAYLEKAFSSAPEMLKGYAARYAQLKTSAAETSHENPSAVQKSCEGLRTSVDALVLQHPEVMRIMENRASYTKSISELSALSSLMQGAEVKEKLGMLLSKQTGLEKFFTGNKPNAAELLPGIDPAAKETLALALDSSEELASALRQYLEETALVELLGEGIPKANTIYASSLRITLTNPLHAFESPMAVELPFESKPEQIALSYKTPNINDAKLANNRLLIEMSSVPRGQSVVSFETKTTPATTAEKTEVLFVSSEKASMHKTIKLSLAAQLPKLLVEVPLKAGSSMPFDVFSYSDGQRISSSIEQGSAALLLENPRNSQTMDIYYSIEKPIEVLLELDSKQQSDYNKAYYVYSLRIRNLTDTDFSNARFVVYFPLSYAGISSAVLTLQDGSELALKQLPPDRFSFMLRSLSPKQSAVLTLSITIDDYSLYWSGVLERLGFELRMLSNSQSESISSNARALLAELEVLKQQDIENAEMPSSIARLNSKVAALKDSEEALFAAGAEYALLKDETELQIDSLRASLPQFRENGYSSHADVLQEASESAARDIAWAEAFASRADYNAALARLLSARSTLTSLPETDIARKVSNDRNAAMHAANGIFETALEFGIDDSNFSKLKDAVLSAERSISEAVASGDYTLATQILNTIVQLVHDANAALLSSLLEKSSAVAGRIKALKNLAENDVPKKISLLKKALQGIGTAQENGYALPISPDRVEELSHSADEPYPRELARELALFESAYSMQNHQKALLLSRDFEPELNTALKKHEAINTELSTALSALREDAYAALSTAAEKAKFSEYSADAEKMLKSAKDEFEKRNYGKSLSLSSAATAILTLSEQPAAFTTLGGFAIPLSVVPLIAVVAIVMYMRYRGKQELAIKQRMLRIFRKRD